jgi:uncharacterized ferritin-like protein (DUF455 family)
MPPVLPPPPNTVERWAWDYVTGTDLSKKLAPPEVPEGWEERPSPRRIAAPGRPPELSITLRAKKTRGLGSPAGRARALHTFLHHELQAAELMAWALLAFPDTPREFRAGLARIAVDEARHMRMYLAHIERLGHAVGEFPVRDWFWERVPTCTSPAAFVAVMGLGLESANLEHTAAYAARFREAGDEEGARVQELVGLEEIAHVRFGARWFAELVGPLEFETWRRALPSPLTPLLMRGRPLAREARLRGGQPPRFLDELTEWQPESPGS